MSESRSVCLLGRFVLPIYRLCQAERTVSGSDDEITRKKEGLHDHAAHLETCASESQNLPENQFENLKSFFLSSMPWQWQLKKLFAQLNGDVPFVARVSKLLVVKKNVSKLPYFASGVQLERCGF